ncbi:hypothetical protein E4U42_005017 [Claviceps africana]|uniref:Conserved oligomeric Golgi complex subunit 6 n=1 Tax=Claviceps africana TaxID=83212 RepID=A0A8K0NKL1_9HYPO|nr:hypothetical protein E4U42_005017 [Claviceps africana]
MDTLDLEPPDDSKYSSSVLYKNSNSLPSKLVSVLSMSFSDPEFRETLSLLDQRHLLNNATNRRQIRLDLQKDVAECNGLVIDQFGRVAEQLLHVKAVLDTLNTEYGDMKSLAEMAQNETSPILQDAIVLLKERELLDNKQNILMSFKDRFVMTEADIVSLTSTAETLDHRFYTSLCKAKKISRECEILLGLEKQTFGLDLMDQVSKYLNLGFQRLYKWIQRELKTFNPENPQMSSSIRCGLRVLAERPSLFEGCIDYFSEVRERVLSESFHVALTGTSPSGAVDDSIKPIDLTAHDAMRYVGDMLAWIHAAAVSEREAMEVLFITESEWLVEDVNLGNEAEVWRRVTDDKGPKSDFDKFRTLGDLVDKNLIGTARQLQQRVEQVIHANEEIVPAYKLATLLSFYRTIFDKLLGSSTYIPSCVRSLETEALRQFRALVKEEIASVQGESQKIPADLAAPKFLIDALEQLKVIMQTYDSSLSSHDNKHLEFETVLSAAFEPFLSACENMAGMLTPLKGSIFIINVNIVAEKCLAAFSFAQRRTELLRQKVKTEASKVVESQYEFFRLESGLEPTLFERRDGITTLKLNASEYDISAASQQLDKFLPSAVMDANDRIRDIQNASIARNITAEAAEMFCQDFETWEREVQKQTYNGANKREALQSVFPRTSADIRVLLL